MPWSAEENRDFLLDSITESDVVLDVGAGAGIWSHLLRHRVKSIDAVEIFEPYLERFNLRDRYDKIYLGDFKTIAIPRKYYSVIILGDVLEHFAMEDALEVWEKARSIVGPTGMVLLSTPIVDWPQGEEEGNIHESHLSFFDMEALKNLSGVLIHKEGQTIGSIIAKGKEPDSIDDVTVVITTIPGRTHMLNKAVKSVLSQTLRPENIVVVTDEHKEGAAKNRDKGLALVTTEYVAFLDDDDYLYPDHIETLYKEIKSKDADIVYSWFDVEGGTDPFPDYFGPEWDPESPRQTTVTILAKTQTIRDAGGYDTENTSDFSYERLRIFARSDSIGEEFLMICNANANGAKIVHIPKKTWVWVHHSKNTSGRPDRW